MTIKDSPQPKSRLRVGVIIDSLSVPNWVYRIISDIYTSDFLNLALIVGKNHPFPRNSFFHRIKDLWTNMLFHFYSKVDYSLFKVKEDSFELADITGAFPEAEFLESDITRIKEGDLDVILHFSDTFAKDEIMNCSKYGVWSIHNGDNRHYRGGPAFFWEMYEKNPVSGSELRVQSEKFKRARVIYRSISATNLYSLYSNRNTHYWKATQFVRWRLRSLYLHGWESIQSLSTFNEPDTYTKGIYRTPGNLTMIKFLAQAAMIHARLKVRYFLFREQWFIAIRKRKNSILSNVRDMSNFRIITPKKDRFYADPFLIKRGNRNYLFFEDYRYQRSKGVISVMEIDEQGNCTNPEIALERDYHLSYPFVFEWKGEVYMMPETGANRTVEIYRAINFPSQWIVEKVLLKNVKASDATLFQENDKFWLFVNLARLDESNYDELFLFYADSLSGEWHSHPKNPIVSDVRRARSAGKLFIENGQLIRPSQDCSVRYGYAISFNRVEVLSETDYREVPIERMNPEWLPNNLGTHTFNQNQDFEVIDGRILTKKPLSFHHSQVKGKVEC